MRLHKSPLKFSDRKGPCVRCRIAVPALIHGVSCVNCGFLAKRWRRKRRR